MVGMTGGVYVVCVCVCACVHVCGVCVCVCMHEWVDNRLDRGIKYGGAEASAGHFGSISYSCLLRPPANGELCQYSAWTLLQGCGHRVGFACTRWTTAVALLGEVVNTQTSCRCLLQSNNEWGLPWKNRSKDGGKGSYWVSVAKASLSRY